MTGLLGYWVTGLLGYWVTGLLGYWVAGNYFTRKIVLQVTLTKLYVYEKFSFDSPGDLQQVPG